MSRGELGEIVDPAIKKAVLEKLKNGREPKEAFADPDGHPCLTSRKTGRRIPIHSARIRKADSTIEVGKGSSMRRVCPGDNHHMEIVAHLDKNAEHDEMARVIVSQFRGCPPSPRR